MGGNILGFTFYLPISMRKVKLNQIKFIVLKLNMQLKIMQLKLTLITHHVHSASKTDNVINQFGNHSGIFCG